MISLKVRFFSKKKRDKPSRSVCLSLGNPLKEMGEKVRLFGKEEEGRSSFKVLLHHYEIH